MTAFYELSARNRELLLLLCALTLLAILLAECRRASGSLSFARRWWPVGALLLCAAGLVGVEFALDKSGLPAFVGYGAMVVLLALIAAAECGAAKRVKAACNVNS